MSDELRSTRALIDHMVQRIHDLEDRIGDMEQCLGLVRQEPELPDTEKEFREAALQHFHAARGYILPGYQHGMRWNVGVIEDEFISIHFGEIIVKVKQ